MLFNILWSACLYTLQIITHMFHKVSAREEKSETCAWLTMCESPEQANRRVLTALPPDTKNFFFHSENIINSGSRPTASDSVCAQNKKSWVWKEENSGRWWCAEPRKWMVSCFTATHPPINRGLGWAPNKTISPLPGTHLRLYCEQRSAAAGT